MDSELQVTVQAKATQRKRQKKRSLNDLTCQVEAHKAAQKKIIEAYDPHKAAFQLGCVNM